MFSLWRALHVLGHHVAVGVHAEGADLVAVLLGTVDQLGLIDHIGDVLEDSGGQLHPHADVHLVVDEGDTQALALVGKPLGAGAAGRGDEPVAAHLVPLLQAQAVAAVGGVDGLDGGVEPELDALLQVLIDVLEDHQVLLGAQVLAPGLEQVEVELQGLLLQSLGLRGGGGEHLGGGAVGHIDGVHILDEVHDLLGIHEVGEPAAEGGGKVEFAVGEGAGAAEAAHGVADLALDAVLHLPRHDGAAPAVDVPALLQDHHLQSGVLFHQLVACVDTGLSTANDGNVVSLAHDALFSFVFSVHPISMGAYYF